MRRVGILIAAVVVLLAGPVAAEMPEPAGELRLSGAGGQRAVLDVGRDGMRIDYPFFRTPRVPGPDGAVGGVLIQRLSTGKVAGGLLLQNAPGFDGAIEMGLVGFDGVTLPKGRYALTLLGEGRQQVSLPLPSGRRMALKAAGPARPISKTAFADGSALHTWSDDMQLSKRPSIVVLGSGGGGERQQAAETHTCFRPAADDDGLCLPPDSSGTMLAPGAGSSASWSNLTFFSEAGMAGDYVYSGRVVAAGLSETGHGSVVITLP